MAHEIYETGGRILGPIEPIPETDRPQARALDRAFELLVERDVEVAIVPATLRAGELPLDGDGRLGEVAFLELVDRESWKHRQHLVDKWTADNDDETPTA
jgi:hypothetical protein